MRHHQEFWTIIKDRVQVKIITCYLEAHPSNSRKVWIDYGEEKNHEYLSMVLPS